MPLCMPEYLCVYIGLVEYTFVVVFLIKESACNVRTVALGSALTMQVRSALPPGHACTVRSADVTSGGTANTV